jgi:hypothetical protein
MDAAHKIVTHLPLEELWRDDGFTTRSRGGSLGKDALTDLLRIGPVQFVVVDVGSPPFWIPLGDCYRFWKEEARPHVAEARVPLDAFPDGYCYFASNWSCGGQAVPIVVVEKHH